MEEQKWYTYNQIISMFGICKQTLNNWRKNGIIRYKKVTKKTFLYQLPENKIIQENGSPKHL
jgi:predicted site-specific integrase-resolvase